MNMTKTKQQIGQVAKKGTTKTKLLKQCIYHDNILNKQTIPGINDVKIWELANEIRGLDPNIWRADAYRNPIKIDIRDNVSIYGWNIDHLNPKNKGGSDEFTNLQPMQAKKNDSIGNKLVKRSMMKNKRKFIIFPNNKLDELRKI